MRRAFVLLAVPLLALGVSWTAHAADVKPACDTAPIPGNVQRITVDGTYQGYEGNPSDGTTPTALVVFFHGYGHTSADWARCHLGRIADLEHVRTVAMDYGDRDKATPTTKNPGWWVQEGATASVAAARTLGAGMTQVIAYGVSMGGNASGLAVLDAPGLFNNWIDIEGATNVIETYLEARTLAPANDFALHAKEDIEAEMGGPIESQADAYRQHDIVARAAEVDVAGVVMCHGVGDGLVPYNQSREMATALRARGIPVDFTTFGLRTPGSDQGTTLDGYANAAVPHDSPFAGHADEDSTNHDVGNCGFARLHEVLTGHFARNREVAQTAF